VALGLLLCGLLPATGAEAARFAVIGDWGYGSADQRAVAERICASGSLDFVLTTGDNFYRPDGRATSENFYGPAACLIASGVEWRAAWGNHDAAGDDTGTVLGAPRSYAFDAGPARVVVVDGTEPTAPSQRQLVERELGRERRFTIVVVHQPVRTAGLKRDPAVAAALAPALDARADGVVVLQGDNHLYERIEHGGVTYVTSGGGGAPLTPCLRPVRGVKRCRPVHHFLLVEIGRDALEIRAVDRRGVRIDRRGVLGARARAVVARLGL
jgi:predicted phosphodiesterase